MSEQPIDRFARRAAYGVSRRASLTSLGVVALGAALAQPLSAGARKRGKKRRNRCKKKVRKQCQREQDECRQTVETLCQQFPDDPVCPDLLLTCCATCNVTNTLTCLIDLVQSQP